MSNICALRGKWRFIYHKVLISCCLPPLCVMYEVCMYCCAFLSVLYYLSHSSSSLLVFHHPSSFCFPSIVMHLIYRMACNTLLFPLCLFCMCVTVMPVLSTSGRLMLPYIHSLHLRLKNFLVPICLSSFPVFLSSVSYPWCLSLTVGPSCSLAHCVCLSLSFFF